MNSALGSNGVFSTDNFLCVSYHSWSKGNMCSNHAPCPFNHPTHRPGHQTPYHHPPLPFKSSVPIEFVRWVLSRPIPSTASLKRPSTYLMSQKAFGRVECSRAGTHNPSKLFLRHKKGWKTERAGEFCEGFKQFIHGSFSSSPLGHFLGHNYRAPRILWHQIV